MMNAEMMSVKWKMYSMRMRPHQLSMPLLMCMLSCGHQDMSDQAMARYSAIAIFLESCATHFTHDQPKTRNATPTPNDTDSSACTAIKNPSCALVGSTALMAGCYR